MLCCLIEKKEANTGFHNSHHQTERNWLTGGDREAKIVYANYKATEIDAA
jgi:hypothetical protein